MVSNMGRSTLADSQAGSQIEPIRESLSTQADAAALQAVTEQLNQLIQSELYTIESPIERAMELLGDKYSFQILYHLQQSGCMRFVELEQHIAGISPRTLSARLKHLEKYRLITRQQYPTIPPKVEYALTDCGQDLAQTLINMETWINRWYPVAVCNT